MPKITALPNTTIPATDDLLPFVDVSGTPTTRKATVENLAASTAFTGQYAPIDEGGRTRVAILGDSIMQGTSGYWYQWLVGAAGGRFVVTQNVAVGGTGSATHLSTQVPLVTAGGLADWCMFSITPNDQGAITVSESIANTKAIATALRAAGIVPIIIMPHPRDLAEKVTHLWEVATAIRTWAETIGVAVLDPCAADIVDTDGSYLSGMSGDGTHPSVECGRLVGAAMADQLPDAMLGRSPLPVINSGPGNLVANGLFIGDANADGTADSWIGGVGVESIEAGTHPIRGNWQTITIADASTALLQQAIALTAGRTYEFVCRVKSSNARPRVRLLGVTWADANADWNTNHGDVNSLTEAEAWVVRRRWTETTTGNRNLFLSASGEAGSCSYAQVGIYDVTPS